MADKKKINTKTAKIVNLNAGKDTIKVEVERKVSHKLYDKIMRFHNNYLVHVKEESKKDLEEGDLIEIAQTSKISKNKSWYAVI
jgi:ribosomal protein S17